MNGELMAKPGKKLHIEIRVHKCNRLAVAVRVRRGKSVRSRLPSNTCERNSILRMRTGAQCKAITRWSILFIIHFCNSFADEMEAAVPPPHFTHLTLISIFRWRAKQLKCSTNRNTWGLDCVSGLGRTTGAGAEQSKTTQIGQQRFHLISAHVRWP